MLTAAFAYTRSPAIGRACTLVLSYTAAAAAMHECEAEAEAEAEGAAEIDAAYSLLDPFQALCIRPHRRGNLLRYQDD